MEGKQPDYILTNHLRERYVERFASKKHYDHFRSCRKPAHERCETCIDLAFDLHEEVKSRRHQLDCTLAGRLRNAHEECSYINNSEFMQRIHRRYGYERFAFLVDDDVLFVVLLKEGKKIVPTCIPSRESVVGGIVARPKYRKKVEEPLLN